MSIVPRPAETIEEVAGTMSQSKFNDWTRCGYYFYRKHVLGERAPQSHTLAFGNAWDRMGDTYYAEVKQCAVRPQATKVQEMFRGALEDEFKTTEDVQEDEPRADMVDQGTALAKKWTTDLAEHIDPIAVQSGFRIELPNAKFAVTGTIDLVGEIRTLARKFVGDNKTSRVSWSDKQVKQSIQRPLYKLGAQRLKLDIDEFQFHVAVRTKQPKLQVLSCHTDQAEMEGALRRLQVANDQIRHAYVTGAWLPNRSSVLCSRRWCPHWQVCQREWGGEVPV